MTDSRLPGHWLTNPIMDGLSDRAWRTFTGSLMWSNEAGTDGQLPRNSMRFLHPEGVDSRTVAELVEADLWRPNGDSIVIPDWDRRMGQELAEVVETRRMNNRLRQRKARAKAKTSFSSVPGDVTRDVTGSTEDRTGEDRTGQDRQLGEHEETNDGRVIDWPTATPGRKAAS